MKKKDLIIRKNTPIYCYGMGKIGKKCADLLKNNGYNVCGFIDKKKKQCENTDFQVYRIEEFVKKISFRCLIIICLADGMSHVEVAEILVTGGYSYISFLPMKLSLPPEKESHMTRLYNRLLVGSPNRNEVLAPVSSKLFKNNFINVALIRQNDTDITVFCPIELLYTQHREKDEKCEEIRSKDTYRDIPYSVLIPYIELFDFFDGNRIDADSYRNRSNVAHSAESWSLELKKREEQWKKFEEKYQNGITFFIDGCPYVFLHPNHFFCTIDGHHRTSFLVHKGHIRIPIRMTYGQYAEWVNMESFSVFKEIWTKQNRSYTSVPIPHPYCMSLRTNRENTSNLVMSKIWKFLFGKSLEGKICLDASKMEGYFARNFLRRGTKAQIEGYNTSEDVMFIRSLFSLLRLPEPVFVTERVLVYNYVFFVNRAKEINESIILDLLNHTEEVLFIEFDEINSFDKYESFLFNNRMRDASKLGTSVVDGIRQELYAIKFK